MDNIFKKLSLLDGLWKGQGHGQFPTIDSFEYEEHLHFDVNSAYPLIYYEQKSILIPTQKPSHWESGFIRVIDNDVIEISNSQDSGRVEILQGNITNGTDVGYEMEFSSIALVNDPRLVNTKRSFKVFGNTMECYQSMTTNTTKEEALLPHLYSKLSKVE